MESGSTFAAVNGEIAAVEREDGFQPFALGEMDEGQVGELRGTRLVAIQEILHIRQLSLGNRQNLVTFLLVPTLRAGTVGTARTSTLEDAPAVLQDRAALNPS